MKHMPADLTAFGLRDLRTMRGDRHVTTALSMLDDEAFGFAVHSGSAEFVDAGRAFGSVSYAWRRSNDDPQKWQEVLAAAEHLATFLDQLADTIVPRCERKCAHGGTCDSIVRQGRCTSTRGHLDEQES